MQVLCEPCEMAERKKTEKLFRECSNVIRGTYYTLGNNKVGILVLSNHCGHDFDSRFCAKMITGSS